MRREGLALAYTLVVGDNFIPDVIKAMKRLIYRFSGFGEVIYIWPI